MVKVISTKTGSEITYQSFKFSGGEIQVKIDQTFEKSVRILARLDSSDEIFKLILVTDALRREGIKINDVFIPYVPYARQDRVMASGESLAIKVFCDLINSQKYKRVTILDPHSEVTSALLDNVSVLQPDLLGFIKIKFDIKNSVLVSPDAGALKKIYKTAQTVNFTGDIITCSKKRDVSTGEITDTVVPYNENYYGKDFIILDDICDGGRTFIELAKKIKEVYNNNIGQIILGVSHGIFSKGLSVLQQDIDKVFCTNSFSDINNSYVEQLNILN